MTYFFHLAEWGLEMYKLPKKRILRKNKEFQKVYRYGHSYADRYLVLYVFSSPAEGGRSWLLLPGRSSEMRWRATVSSDCCEAYRLNQDMLKSRHCLLLVGRKAATDVKYSVIREVFSELGPKGADFKTWGGLNEADIYIADKILSDVYIAIEAAFFVVISRHVHNMR